MKQQWQEERPDQIEITAKNIPQINTKHTPLTRSNGWEKSHHMPSYLDGDLKFFWGAEEGFCKRL